MAQKYRWEVTVHATKALTDEAEVQVQLFSAMMSIAPKSIAIIGKPVKDRGAIA